MGFEFDPEKSTANKQKHGIDFVEAQTLWTSFNVHVPLPYVAEERAVVIGRLDERYWTAVITMRGQVVRIISVRRSRKAEVEIYEDQAGSPKNDFSR